MFSKRSFLITGSLIITSTVVVIGCGRPGQQYTPTQVEVSQDHLREALLALDRGDEDTAERELKSALSENPLNDRARSHLASLYAHQGGISLDSWLDPILEAGRTLGNNVGGLHQYSSNVIDSLVDDLKKISEQTESQLGPDELAARNRAADMTAQVSKISLALGVFLEVFRSIPFLTQTQLGKLDQAIQILRPDAIVPADRNEEHRMYLAVLGFIRFVNTTKRLLGDDNLEHINFDRSELCRIQTKTLHRLLKDVRASLEYIEEGLTISPKDPPSSKRDARARLNEHVTRILTNEFWNQMDLFFDPTTVEGKTASKLTEQFCSVQL